MVRRKNFAVAALAFSCSIVFTGAAQPAAHSVGVDSQKPRVFLLDAAKLVRIRNGAGQDLAAQAVVRAAEDEATRVIHQGPFSVTQKAIAPPSGNKHDYMSQAPYFWPDPGKPNGLPYIRRDGQRNPEIRKITDHDEFGEMGHDARALALAYFFTGNVAYADRAALLLRTWFLEPATRMNPNLEFGQGIPGINTGRGIGIIESRSLLDVTEAAGLLAGAPSWTPGDQKGLETWLTQYLAWMRTSEKGKAEDAAKNNHGTWYDLQVADFALFLNDRKLAINTLKGVNTRRIPIQIEPDGRQPLELARTNAWGYSNGNLDGLTQLAALGSEVDVDIWDFRTSDGRSIRAAIDYLLPYALNKKKWEYPQISGFNADSLLHSLQRAAAAYKDTSYEDGAKELAAHRHDLETLLLQMN